MTTAPEKTTAPDVVWNTYDEIRRRNPARLAELHARSINATALRNWAAHDDAHHSFIREQLAI